MPAVAARRPASLMLAPKSLVFVSLLIRSALGRFEPYALNGGLVAAIAGRDYVVVASDTRLTDGGYQIHSRRYLTGRLWLAGSIGSLGDGAGAVLEADGSVRVPMLPASLTVTAQPSAGPKCRIPFASGATFVASCGCAADCEALKRIIRDDATSHAHWVNAGSHPTISAGSVATMLMQTLYSRRPFPYYAFCVLAGMDDIDAGGTGRVHVYDAIGSHERVAVACAGAPGREMLQPILDRLFATTVDSTGRAELYHREGNKSLLRRDGRAVPAHSQRVGALGLGPPVETHVDCSADEAVRLVVQAYRSVSEREINVGDDVVVCILRRNGGFREENGKELRKDGTLEVLRFPLKKH
uniref:Proteasome subunit beta n=1 Tax=Trieres chinensis TaxID=1514140 RepID=A0A6U1WAA8_TRICV|mmetsp:Transcript_2888/g.6203  ORF Transcript_2888/g.6203 Transcript_2888/m.6203 type:complete len:355 (+) Transcript_2888:55-1119(+)